MRSGTLATVVLAAGTLALAACGGSSDRATLTDEEIDRVLSDPAMMRLEGILDRSDTLLVPSIHLYFSLSSEGATIDDRLVEEFSCTGASCAGDDGTALSVRDLINPSDQIRNPPDEIRPAEFAIDSRGGFDHLDPRGAVRGSRGRRGGHVHRRTQCVQLRFLGRTWLRRDRCRRRFLFGEHRGNAN